MNTQLIGRTPQWTHEGITKLLMDNGCSVTKTGIDQLMYLMKSEQDRINHSQRLLKTDFINGINRLVTKYKEEELEVPEVTTTTTSYPPNISFISSTGTGGRDK